MKPVCSKLSSSVPLAVNSAHRTLRDRISRKPIGWLHKSLLVTLDIRLHGKKLLGFHTCVHSKQIRAMHSLNQVFVADTNYLGWYAYRHDIATVI